MRAEAALERTGIPIAAVLVLAHLVGMGGKRQGAQNQHYVPKFILRNFLSDPSTERVSVFRKSTRGGFTTSIDNVMAERRFHDIAIGADYIASFEEAIGKIEDAVLPTYRSVLETRRLTNDPMEKASLAIFVAFQFLRTRGQRDRFLELEQHLKAHLTKHGGKIEDIEGYEPLDTDKLKMQHIEFMRSNILQFSQVIAAKDFLLMQAPSGRAFYLADNPVSLHNSEPADPFYGNIGLGVRGIEIYVPLSSDLMLAAFCPSIFQGFRKSLEDQKTAAAQTALAGLTKGLIDRNQARAHIEGIRKIMTPARSILEAHHEGRALEVEAANMDFSNSLQMAYARDFVVCAKADFKLARRFVDETPDARGSVLTSN